MKLKKWIFIAILLVIFYYAFIVNFFVTLSIIASLFVAFRLYKFYARKKLNKLSASKELFRSSELGHFISLVAKVAKADGRVDELEAQLIGMMFDDISKLFNEKEKTRAIMKEIFNEEKQRDDDTKEIAQSLNKLLGRSMLKRKQFVGFLIQLAFVDDGISSDEEKVLRQIVEELNMSSQIYDEFVNKFDPGLDADEEDGYDLINDNVKQVQRKRKAHKNVKVFCQDCQKNIEVDPQFKKEPYFCDFIKLGQKCPVSQ